MTTVDTKAAVETKVLPPADKQCLGCYKLKPLTEFYHDPAGRFGVKGQCKVCLAAHRAALPPKPHGVTKTCSHCRTELPTASFYKKVSNRDGLSTCCKPCYILKYHRKV